MPLAGRAADVKITSLTGTTSTGEASTRSTGVGSGTGYVRINDATKRHWDPDSTPVLYLNSTAVSSTAYSVNYVQGIFQWLSGDPTTGTYTSDVEYLTASSVAGGREWSLGVEQDMFEVSTFGSSGWKQFQPNLVGASLSIGRYWNDSDFLDYLTLDSRFLVELQISSTGGWRYEGFARVRADAITTSVDAIVGETVNLDIDGQLYYTT